MLRPTTVIYGAGAQEVEVYALDNARRVVRPSTATATIVDLWRWEDDPGRVVLEETEATVDATSTTLTASAGPRQADQRKLELTAIPAGLVIGRRYLVRSDARSEAITLDRIDTNGLAVYAREPLRYDYAAADVFDGLRISVEFPAAIADDETQLQYRRQFAVDWTFAGVDGPGRDRTIVTIERLARAGWATTDDLNRIDSQLAAVHGDRVPLEPRIEQAELELAARIEGRGYYPEQLVATVPATQAVAWRAVELVYRLLGPGHEGRAQWAAGEAEKWATQVLVGYPPTNTVELSRRTDTAQQPTRKSAFRPA